MIYLDVENKKINKQNKEYKNIESIEGHTYNDYIKYKEEHKCAIETQMDTVIGITNANNPVILTLEIVESFPNINIFYCHPYSSFEKGNIENNHELLRRIIPKGISLKLYTQNDYNKISSNINSLYRKKLNGKCPFDLVEKYIPLETLKKWGLKK